MWGEKNKKNSCGSIPLRKTKNKRGTVTKRVGDASSGTEKKTKNSLARLSL